MTITNEKFKKTLGDARFAILKDDEPIVSSEFEDGGDYFVEDYDEEIANLVNECIREFDFEDVDDETLEIFSLIQEEGSIEDKEKFINLVAKYPELTLVSWVGTIEHCDMVYDVFYDKATGKFYSLEEDECGFGEPNYGLVDDIDNYELTLNA